MTSTAAPPATTTATITKNCRRRRGMASLRVDMRKAGGGRAACRIVPDLVCQETGDQENRDFRATPAADPSDQRLARLPRRVAALPCRAARRLLPARPGRAAAAGRCGGAHARRPGLDPGVALPLA